MPEITLLEQVKAALRVSNNALDALEIEPIVSACEADLDLAGVNNIDRADPLIIRAVVLYAKANFGYDEEQERYSRAYEQLKKTLALSQKYGGSDARQSE